MTVNEFEKIEGNYKSLYKKRRLWEHRALKKYRILKALGEKRYRKIVFLYYRFLEMKTCIFCGDKLSINLKNRRNGMCLKCYEKTRQKYKKTWYQKRGKALERKRRLEKRGIKLQTLDGMVLLNNLKKKLNEDNKGKI